MTSLDTDRRELAQFINQTLDAREHGFESHEAYIQWRRLDGQRQLTLTIRDRLDRQREHLQGVGQRDEPQTGSTGPGVDGSVGLDELNRCVSRVVVGLSRVLVGLLVGHGLSSRDGEERVEGGSPLVDEPDGDPS